MARRIFEAILSAIECLFEHVFSVILIFFERAMRLSDALVGWRMMEKVGVFRDWNALRINRLVGKVGGKTSQG